MGKLIAAIFKNNAPYHCIQVDKAPSPYALKGDMIEWLRKKGVECNETMLIVKPGAAIVKMAVHLLKNPSETRLRLQPTASLGEDKNIGTSSEVEGHKITRSIDRAYECLFFVSVNVFKMLLVFLSVTNYSNCKTRSISLYCKGKIKIQSSDVNYYGFENSVLLQSISYTSEYGIVMFIDYTKAFDSLNRKLVIQKIRTMIGTEYPLVSIIEDALQYNYIEIDDGVSRSKTIIQTNGVLQGDPISPLLFNIMTADIVEILERKTSTTLIMYADDMALASPNREELQETLLELDIWAEENQLSINMQKTCLMTFRKGGRTSTKDIVMLHSEPLTTVNSFKYLGVTLQTRDGKTYFLVTVPTVPVP
ncbi:hypothetical protein ANN_17702 [Periplaneta americana]|uniref:Reverse transcriptase domain-containing protein n=1 Tax=Periplaneta americana TaxID=6978 RepID=A0ABQ8SV73_PERAM|nr:hypothetical protein ANN_17702 [Periplaneta americana]